MTDRVLFEQVSLGQYCLTGRRLYRKTDDHLVKRVVDGRSEAAPSGCELVEPVTITTQKEAWPIPADEQEWMATCRLPRFRLLQPVGVGATEQAAIRGLAALLESDLGDNDAV